MHFLILLLKVYIIKNPFQEHDNSYCKKFKNLSIKSNYEIKKSNFNFQIINNVKKSLKRNESFCDYKSNISILDNSLEKGKKEMVSVDKINYNNNNNNNNKNDKENSNNNISNKKIENNNKIINFNYINNINTINNRYLNDQQENLLINKDQKDNNIFDEDKGKDKHFVIKKMLLKNNINKIIDENNSERVNDKKIKSNNKNNEELKDNKELYLKNFIYDHEKKKILINKIFGNSQKIIIEKRKIIGSNRNINNIFKIKSRKQNKEYLKKEIMNKTFNFRNNKVIKTIQNNHKTYNSFSLHRERSKTFSDLINERNNSKSNIFRMSHIKNYLKVLQKKEKKEILLNTKWLKNISKKNIPLLCFGKK